MNIDLINEIITELSYRCSSGVPDLNNPEHLNILSSILNEMNIPDSGKVISRLLKEDEFDDAFGTQNDSGGADLGSAGADSGQPIQSAGADDSGEDDGSKKIFNDLLNDPATMVLLGRERDILTKLANVQSFETKILKFRELVRMLVNRRDSFGNPLGATSTERGSLIIGVERGSNLDSTKELIKMLNTLPTNSKVKFIGSYATIDSFGNYKYKSEQHEIKMGIQNHFAECEFDVVDDILDILDTDSPLIKKIEDEFDNRDIALAAIWALSINRGLKMDYRNYITKAGADWLISQLPEPKRAWFVGVDWSNLNVDQADALDKLKHDEKLTDSDFAICRDIYHNHKNLGFYRKIKEAESKGFIAIATISNNKFDKLKEYDINGVLLEANEKSLSVSGVDWEKLIVLAYNNLSGTDAEKMFGTTIYKKYLSNKTAADKIATRIRQKFGQVESTNKMFLMADRESDAGVVDNTPANPPYIAATTKADVYIENGPNISIKKSGGYRLFQGGEAEMRGIFKGADVLCSEEGSVFYFRKASFSDRIMPFLQTLIDKTFEGKESVQLDDVNQTITDIKKDIMIKWIDSRVKILFAELTRVLTKYKINKSPEVMYNICVNHALYEINQSKLLAHIFKSQSYIIEPIYENPAFKIKSLINFRNFQDALKTIKVVNPNEVKKFFDDKLSNDLKDTLNAELSNTLSPLVKKIFEKYDENRKILESVLDIYDRTPEIKTACIFEGATGLYKFTGGGIKGFGYPTISSKKVANALLKFDANTGQIGTVVGNDIIQWAKDNANNIKLQVTLSTYNKKGSKYMHSHLDAFMDVKNEPYNIKTKKMVTGLLQLPIDFKINENVDLYKIVVDHFVNEEINNNVKYITEVYNNNLSIITEIYESKSSLLKEGMVDFIQTKTSAFKKTIVDIIDEMLIGIKNKILNFLKQLLDKGLEYLLNFMGFKMEVNIEGDVTF
jgi:hypothetical protein